MTNLTRHLVLIAMKGRTVKFTDARQQYVRWLRDCRSLSEHTVRAYDCDIGSLGRALSYRPTSAGEVGEISADSLVRYISDARRGGSSSATLRRRRSGLRGFCRWLVDEGHLDADPWLDVKFEARRHRSLPRAVASHDLTRLVTAKLGSRSNPGDGDPAWTFSERTTWVATTVMIVTGVRVGELVAIGVHDIDGTTGTIRVLGKGHRERQVYLPEGRVADFVMEFVVERSAMTLAHDRLFVGQAGAPLSTAAMRSRLAKVARANGITTHVTPHMLRHSAATQLIEAGVDIRFVQRLLGHASLSTTEIYTHVSDSALKRVISQADVLGRIAVHN